jgi:hypothetical protein
VIDTKPRHFTAQQYQMLGHLAEVVVRELEEASLLRWRQLELEAAKTGMNRLVRGLHCFSGEPAMAPTEREQFKTLCRGAVDRQLRIPQTRPSGCCSSYFA